MHRAHGRIGKLLRLVCAFALLVAGISLPVARASACPASPSRTRAAHACGKPCCEKNAPAVLSACCHKAQAKEARAGHPHAVAGAEDPCKCQLKSGAPVADRTVKAPSGEVETFLAALAPASLPSEPPLGAPEPRIFGPDSGPPPGPRHLRDFGRAPPVARA